MAMYTKADIFRMIEEEDVEFIRRSLRICLECSKMWR